MLLDADDSQLVLVDYQARLMPVILENELVVANAVRLARMARLLQVPVWGTAQNPEKLGQNLPEVQSAIDSAGGGAEMHLGQRLATSGINGRLQLGQVLAQLVGGLGGAPDRHFHDAGHAGQTQGIGNDPFIFKNGGHQAGLVVHQYELGVIGIEQHVYSLFLIPEREASAQNAWTPAIENLVLVSE
jgi:hypothetical protein